MEDLQPAAGSAFVEASSWVEQLLTGSLGTAIAIIVVAVAGIAMMQGRLAIRQALQIILGAFILFGAPSIAQGLTNAAKGYGGPLAVVPAAVSPPELPRAAPQFDPYAGASTQR